VKILKLSANQPTFKTVCFNENGLTLILGRRKDTSKIQQENTYNGIGKSLIIYLIHFCLGSDENQELSDKLPDWEFYLDILVEGVQIQIKRKTNNQKILYFGASEMELSDFRDIMLTKNFPNTNFPYLTFRSLIKRFIRLEKEAYSKYDISAKRETEFSSLVYFLFTWHRSKFYFG
jgi:uncharacterized protein YydD (DUF2326 family)